MTRATLWPPQRLHTQRVEADIAKHTDRFYERLYEAVGALMGPRDAFAAEVMAQATDKANRWGDRMSTVTAVETTTVP